MVFHESINELLVLEASLPNWIIIRRAAAATGIFALYRKLISDYAASIPFFEVENIFNEARFNFEEEQVNELLDLLFTVCRCYCQK